jgi:hypothetical protein
MAAGASSRRTILVGFVALEECYEPGTREPRMAWVVQFMVPGVDAMQRALIELDGEPATDEERAAELGAKAKAVVEQGAPAAPSPFGHAPTGLGSNAEIRELIQLTGYALDSAASRVMTAAQDQRPHAVMPLNVAVTEMMGWLRTLDELGDLIWNEKLTSAQRESASRDGTPSNGSRCCSSPPVLPHIRRAGAGATAPAGSARVVLPFPSLLAHDAPRRSQGRSP